MFEVSHISDHELLNEREKYELLREREFETMNIPNDVIAKIKEEANKILGK